MNKISSLEILFYFFVMNMCSFASEKIFAVFKKECYKKGPLTVLHKISGTKPLLSYFYKHFIEFFPEIELVCQLHRLYRRQISILSSCTTWQIWVICCYRFSDCFCLIWEVWHKNCWWDTSLLLLHGSGWKQLWCKTESSFCLQGWFVISGQAPQMMQQK